MPKSELHQSLRDLNDEIEKTQTDDEDKQALDLPEPLEKAVILFEHDHPSLSRAIEITVNSLSAMGI
jgi:hypothetical protein